MISHGRHLASVMESGMQFEEWTEGDYRIYAGALEALRGDGYTAAVVVKRVKPGATPSREAYRDECLAGGHRWESANEALRYALSKARQFIRSQSQALAC